MNPGYYNIGRNINMIFDHEYTAKNKKGKDSKNWETQYKNIWNGKKR